MCYTWEDQKLMKLQFLNQKALVRCYVAVKEYWFRVGGCECSQLHSHQSYSNWPSFKAPFVRSLCYNASSASSSIEPNYRSVREKGCTLKTEQKLWGNFKCPKFSGVPFGNHWSDNRPIYHVAQNDIFSPYIYYIQGVSKKCVHIWIELRYQCVVGRSLKRWR